MSVHQKTSLRQWKRQATEWEKIFTKQIAPQGLYAIYIHRNEWEISDHAIEKSGQRT